MATACRAKGCGEMIDFVKNARGKYIPVPAGDPEPMYLFPGQPGHPQVVVVLENGEVIRGRKGHPSENGVLRVNGWESHFSSCPGAAEFRRKDEG
jgi:hypothetical protein